MRPNHLKIFYFMNIAAMAESAASSYIDMEQQSNTANANAYLAPANMNPFSVLNGQSLLIEPSENGIPEPPTGGSAPDTKIPGSPKMDSAGGASGTRPEGVSSTSGGKSFRTEGHSENRIGAEQASRNIEHLEHHSSHQEIIKNNSMESLEKSERASLREKAA